MAIRRPPSWSISATSKRIEFDDSKYTNAEFRGYRDDDLTRVFKFLGKNTNVETIKLRSCKIGDEASRSMRQGLCDNAVVSELMVYDSVVGPRKFKRILQGIAANEENEITDMSFVNCDLDDRSMRFFDEVLVSPPPDNEILMKSLTLLDLHNNKIGDRGAVSLSYLLGAGSLLSKLLLSSNRIGNLGAKALGAMLKDNKMLHTLELGHNIIGAEGGIALAQGLDENKFLVCLELQSNRIGAEGALEFARVLDEDNIGKTGLSTLNIACNSIGDVGGSKMQAIAEQKIIGNLIINGNQVGVCNCKNCVLVSDVDPDHWAFEVGKFDAVVLDIDDNGGNLTASNNSTEHERDGDVGGMGRGPLAKLKPRLKKDTSPKKIGFKPPRPKIDAHGNKILDKAGTDLKQRLRQAGMAKEGKSYLELQLENAAGSLGKMTVGSKMDRDGGDGTVGMAEGDGTIE
eukprot:CAMPEP_0197566338 /NCGR_PEP_ID=MMETSP1320-20131121/33685_1 /TAXON_ID=91990 /ORGANISM="Bolidomonas sp., Strain RCC2347" /LENGTH=457 /DNA_ID=CAMNT_0043128427 /DNA_START=77 /DNA_END=1447 /DNA_ORIENTATION=+